MFEIEAHGGLSQSNSKFVNKSLKSLETALCFGNGRFWRPSKLTVFRKVGKKNTHFEKKKATENRIALKECKKKNSGGSTNLEIEDFFSHCKRNKNCSS